LKASGDAVRQPGLEQPRGGAGRRGGELFVPLTRTKKLRQARA
jgi:hypothetical protein